MVSRRLSGTPDQLESGGKVLRGRRRMLQNFSPYSRPTSSPVLMSHSVPETRSGRSPSWLRSLISGVGKLFLSALGTEGSGSPPSECFSNHSSDEYCDYSASEHEDALHSDDLTALKMRKNVDRIVKSLAIVPKSESKLVIEQMLRQETFTRDECNKLIGIIRSRVPGITSDQGQYLNQDKNLYGTSNLSSNILSSFSPRLYSNEIFFPDLRNKAVMEAKKWFEEKRLSPSLVGDQELGSRIRNNRIDHYGFESDGSSPIEMAKSYMQSLPSLRSPSGITVALKTRSSSGKVNRRDYFGTGLFNSEDHHSTYMSSLYNEQKFSNLGQSNSFSRLSTIPSATTKTCNDLQVECDEKAAGEDELMDTDDGHSAGAILQPNRSFKESQTNFKVASSNDIADLSVSEDVEIRLQIEKQICSNSAHQDSCVCAPVAGRNIGETFTEAETLQLENIIPAVPSVQKDYGDGVSFQINNSAQANVDPTFKNKYPITDSDPPDGDPHAQNDPIELVEKFEIGSSNSQQVNNTKTGFELMIKGDLTADSSSCAGDLRHLRGDP